MIINRIKKKTVCLYGGGSETYFLDECIRNDKSRFFLISRGDVVIGAYSDLNLDQVKEIFFEIAGEFSQRQMEDICKLEK